MVGTTAEVIAETPGLRWKIWSLNEADSEFCGICLFDDDDAVRRYLAGPIMDLIRNDTTNTNLSVKQYAMVEGLTTLTRDPIGEHAEV